MGIRAMLLIVALIILVIIVVSITVWSRVLVHLLRAATILLRASPVVRWSHIIYFKFRVSFRFLRVLYDVDIVVNIL
jgi:hypothetical protein